MTISVSARGAALAAAGAIALAGCGSSSSSSSTATSTPASAHSATVRLGSSSLGRILVNGSGRTLYLFKADHGTRSACYGACAAAWPPLLTQGRASAGGGALARLLGVTIRRGGARQVTYAGHPLYLFIDDSGPGQTNGEGSRAFGGQWDAVTAAGHAVQPSAHRAAVTSTSATVPGY